MNVLVVGSGGREHTLAWTLAKSPLVQHIYVAPGNAGTSWNGGQRARAENIAIDAGDIAGLLDFAQTLDIGLTVVGPEAPLAAGIVDAFRRASLPIFGCSSAAAQLETSKSFAKNFMREVGIPTAAYSAFTHYDDAAAYVRAVGHSVVVKADGLAAGKGVIVCDTVDEALSALRRMLIEGEFGAAGARVVVEERLSGVEMSALAFCDGKTAAPMPLARDHKRIFDGDDGANTGGMGAYAPVPEIAHDLIEKIRLEVLQRAVDGMAARGMPFTGVLYAGLMLTPYGLRVLEFNARFGDPETQVLLPLLNTDLAEIMLACIDERLSDCPITWHSGSCACVVAAAPGYPGEYKKGLPISGIEAADALPDTQVFHAGTQLRDGVLVTNGGRVLCVSGRGETLAVALDRAYTGIRRIWFEGLHFRSDIGGHADVQRISAYTRAGVDIDAGNRAVQLMTAAVKSTYSPEVLAGIGAFGGLFDGARLQRMSHPVLVASTDGVGTKTMAAARANRWENIGRDLVNHCINDILVQGARPLFFLDYIASSKLDPERIAMVVEGMAAACREAGCALLGGETAEMPGIYQEGELDVVGTLIGAVERAALIDGSRITSGCVVIGLPSSGLHTNGYSLARRALGALDWSVQRDDLDGATIADVLLAPHRSYLPEIDRLQNEGVDILGLAHITGGGLIENPPRIFPDKVGMIIDQTWAIPPIFPLIQRIERVSDQEMARVFNLGIGMVMIMNETDAHRAFDLLDGAVRLGIITDDPAAVGSVVIRR